ncbi:hypothetical protein SDC9_197993 [bioreactor metagenome]|uniref:Uncharacterized protein n=1 Tax=bioreactor metagenome TaxID=1076179 RepID=A0A645IGE9_9ZZZZ
MSVRRRNEVFNGPEFRIVFMVMSENPAVEIQPPRDLVEVRGERIVEVRLISQIPCQKGFEIKGVKCPCRRRVGKHDIYPPAVCCKLADTVFILLFARLLLRPPGVTLSTQDLVDGNPAAKTPGLHAPEIIDMPPLFQVED